MRLNISIWHAFLALLCVMLPYGINADLEARQKFLPKLFKGYKSLLVPQENATEPVKVTLGLTLKRVVSLDQENQVFSTIVFLQMKWADPRLQWDPEAAGFKTISVPSTKVWTPDITLYETIDAMTPLMETRVIIMSDGQLTKVVPYSTRSSCEVAEDSREAECSLTFGSWTENAGVLEVEPMSDRVDASKTSRNHRWELGLTTAEREEIQFAELSFSSVKFTINMKKRPHIDPVKKEEDSGATLQQTSLLMLPLLIAVLSRTL